MATHRRTSRALLVLAAALAYVAVLAGYTRTTLFDSSSFGDRTVQAVRAEPVRAALAEAFADQLIAQEPRLIAARPVLIGGAESVLASGASGAVISRAARDLHRGLLTTDQPSIVVDLADLTVLVSAYLEASGTELDLARLQAPQRELATTISERTLGTQVAHVAARLSVIALVSPLLALLAIAGASALAGDRRRVLRDAGLALMGTGALLVTTQVIVVGTIVERAPQGAPAEVVRAVLDAYLGGLTTWALLLGGAGALLAASAATLMSPLDASGLPRLAWNAAIAVPERSGRRVLRAMVLLLAGAAIVASPEGALRLAATLAGGYVALVGLTALLGEVLGPASSSRRSVPLRRGVVIATAALTLLVPTAAAIAVSAGSDDAPASQGAQDDRCNGDTRLCDRRLDEVVFPTVHNAMSNAADGFLNANNGPSIETQLDLGIRGLLIDALAGQRNASGTVRTDLTGTTEDQVVAQIGRSGLAAAQRLAGRVAFGPISGKRSLYLCHVLCELGATDALDEFRRLDDWVERHPRDVLVIFVQDEASAAMITSALRESGLADHAATLRLGQPLPTLGALIERGTRVVVMAENHAGAPWYPAGFTFAQDTPYSFSSTAQLRTAASCKHNRGTADAPMLLVNHWVETYPPNPKSAEIANQPPFLLDRARRCMRERGLVPNLLAVDFVERGDVVGAAATLNDELLQGRTTP